MSREDAYMKFAQLLFSPTGGTQKVTEAITGAWEAEVETIDLTDPAISPYALRRRIWS